MGHLPERCLLENIIGVNFAGMIQQPLLDVTRSPALKDALANFTSGKRKHSGKNRVQILINPVLNPPVR
jgi:hypothetical protein